MTRLCAKLALILALLTPLTAHATADGPDAWRVQGVASHDHLNVRVGPGVDYFVIDALPHNARQVQVVVCTPTTTREQYFALPHHLQQRLNSYSTWCLVNWNGHQRGWVNRRFLTEDGV
ncbi:SH3 domain-containing protein [Jannaschia sp. CCS1]|uniref:SH3 domain-containing protein n=1 Tax=Jannaschia sp. (strain CCS1) TaxID=290400 RepID=UPI0002E9DCAC|nr:SH3 domain-containing protein [Jannaschia sp. CCS1]